MLSIRTFTPDEVAFYCQALTSTETYNKKPMAQSKTIKAYAQYGLKWQWSLEVEELYGWSDLHYGHAKIIEYANRPFDTVETMNRALLEAKNTIPSEAWLLYGGDIAFQTHGYQAATRGHHDIYVLGNHDLHHGRLHPFFQTVTYPAVGIMIDNGEQQWSMAHYPVRFPDRHTIHGHTHQHLIEDFTNICVEHTDYRPRLLPLLQRA